MAKRRMMSQEVVESDVFVSLTPSAQALYFHLIMNADDDGFVDMWKGIIRYLGVRYTHFQSLVDLGYVILFDDDVLLISDWRIHNNISLKRYSAGRYKDRINTLLIHKDGRYFKAFETFLTPQVK